MLIEIFTGNEIEVFRNKYYEPHGKSYPNKDTVYNTIVGLFNTYPSANKKSNNPFVHFQKDIIFQELVFKALDNDSTEFKAHLNQAVNNVVGHQEYNAPFDYLLIGVAGLTAFGIYKLATKKSKRRK